MIDVTETEAQLNARQALEQMEQDARKLRERANAGK